MKDDPEASYESNLLVKEWVDDALGDGDYDVRGALAILKGMITGRQGITRVPSVYKVAMDHNLCTEDLFNFVTSLVLDSTNCVHRYGDAG